MVHLAHLLTVFAVLTAHVRAFEQEEELFGGPALISPDQDDESFENVQASFFGRLLTWAVGDNNEGSSLRGGGRSLWSSGSCNSFSSFFSSCSNRESFSTGNTPGTGSVPNRPTSTRPPQVPITTLLTSAGKFGDLLTLVEAAGLTDTLASEGPWTVFAPTDDAFKWYNIEAASASPDLARILTYHVVAGEYKAEDLSDGIQLTTVEGQNITISLPAGGQPKINCDSTITMVDMEGSNGVVHTIGWPLNVFQGNKATCP